MICLQMYELCCDMIDLLINMSEIYGQPNFENDDTINHEAVQWNNEAMINGDPSYINDGKNSLNTQKRFASFFKIH